MGWHVLEDAGKLVLPFSDIRSGKLDKIWSVRLLEFRLQSLV